MRDVLNDHEHAPKTSLLEHLAVPEREHLLALFEALRHAVRRRLERHEVLGELFVANPERELARLVLREEVARDGRVLPGFAEPGDRRAGTLPGDGTG